MTPAAADYKAHVRGDTINERIFTLTKTINLVETPIDLTNSDIQADFKLNNNTELKELGSGITMIDATLGKFKIDSFTLPKVGTWDYDVQITFPSGLIKTWVKGVISIENDVTK